MFINFIYLRIGEYFTTLMSPLLSVLLLILAFARLSMCSCVPVILAFRQTLAYPASSWFLLRFPREKPPWATVSFFDWAAVQRQGRIN